MIAKRRGSMWVFGLIRRAGPANTPRIMLQRYTRQMTYFNPYAGDRARSREHWLNYLNDATIAKYTADSIGAFIERSSQEQLAAFDEINGTLEDGFAGVQGGLVAVADEVRALSDQQERGNRLLAFANAHLEEISNGIEEANAWLQSMDSRLSLMLEEQRIGNVMAENIAELLHIPESEKERHRWIAMGLKFFKNAGRDADFYQDALKYFHMAEAAMPEDYFVLRQIGMLHLYAAPLLDLEKASDYLSRAGKYASVESHPDAVRLGHVLAKSVLPRFRDQPDATAGDIAAFAVESYRHAAVGRYALGNFSEALRLIEKALGLDASSSALRFLQAKYLAAAGKHDLALAALRALPANDETIAAVSADLDLAGSVAPRWLPEAKVAAEAAMVLARSVGRRARVLAKVTSELVRIPPGTFTMGSDFGNSDEKPMTRVTFTKAFWLGKYQVTQQYWFAVMGTKPSFFQDGRRPVENVSWDEAMEFCRRLTETAKAAGQLPEGYAYMLPSEAQWEYACRAGTTGDFAGQVEAMAVYSENAGGTTHVVGTKQANAWGLHDMHGNVWDWCLDWKGSYSGGSVIDPMGAASGSLRVYRGGSWSDGAGFCRSANRCGNSPGVRFHDLGFRLALSSVH
jgi:formylglycine-generating enzyme required for sulfatase activity